MMCATWREGEGEREREREREQKLNERETLGQFQRKKAPIKLSETAKPGLYAHSIETATEVKMY